MSKVSKTARASTITASSEKKIISDENYIKNLRYDVSNGIHATQEGAKALLRAYDALEVELGVQHCETEMLAVKLNAAELAVMDKAVENEKLYKDYLEAGEHIRVAKEMLTERQARIDELEIEIRGLRAAYEGPGGN